MSPTAIITIGLLLVVCSSAMILVAHFAERRRDLRAKRLECLKDPINCRNILKR